MVAAFNGNADNVKALVERGMDVNAIVPAGSNAEGYTALIHTGISAKPDMVKILLEHGANVHFKLRDWYTALRNASALQYTETIRLLKQAGAAE